VIVPEQTCQVGRDYKEKQYLLEQMKKHPQDTRSSCYRITPTQPCTKGHKIPEDSKAKNTRGSYLSEYSTADSA
jgi:hypothetical protein